MFQYKCRYADCHDGNPVAGEDEEITCHKCRIDLGLPSVSDSELEELQKCKPDCVHCAEKRERDAAIPRVLSVLRSPLALVSKPNRAEVYELARRFSITAEELLDVATKRARNA